MLPMRELQAACLDELDARESIKRLILNWLNCVESDNVVCEKTKYSDMHLFGLGLSYVLCTHDPLGTREYNAKEELGEFHKQLTNDIDVHTCTWIELRQLISSLQTSYIQLITYDRFTGYDCKVDVSNYVLALMTRIGALLGTMFLWETLSVEEQVRFSDYYEHETDGYYIVKASAGAEVMDILHCFMRLVLTLMHAKPVGPAPSRPDLSQFHHEASLDDFYQIATARDCLPGSILAYKHQFHGLFHDVSQVAYFLFPTYSRAVQKPINEILSGSVTGANILPLLMQVKPDVPVLFEHTAEKAKQHKWAWLVWHHHILLSHVDGAVYCGENVFDLFAYMTEQGASHDATNQTAPEQRQPNGHSRLVRPRTS
jgi:hypothetical protein